MLNCDAGFKDPDTYSDTHPSLKTRKSNIDVYLEEGVNHMEYENFLKSMEPTFELIKVRQTTINEEETHTLLAGYGFLFKFVKNDENYDENKATFINKLWEEYTRLHIDREPEDLKIIELVSYGLEVTDKFIKMTTPEEITEFYNFKTEKNLSRLRENLRGLKIKHMFTSLILASENYDQTLDQSEAINTLILNSRKEFTFTNSVDGDKETIFKEEIAIYLPAILPPL